ncbi:nitrate/nitrite transporter NrtS [Nocardia sp. NPDC046763]|uniref:nitrate/nitrite transporter NrtS n=1 Tax=Nocardia sp. NPDC046763 TaxID=3155256 RepID=UPI0033E2DD11
MPDRGDQRWQSPTEALRLLLRGATARTAGPTAVVVGTVLSLVNQGGDIASGDVTPATWIRIEVNYLVPFLVASIGWLSARRTSTSPAPARRHPQRIPPGMRSATSPSRHQAER